MVSLRVIFMIMRLQVFFNMSYSNVGGRVFFMRFWGMINMDDIQVNIYNYMQYIVENSKFYIYLGKVIFKL